MNYSGQYYFNARWYDPKLGRFMTEDPIKDGLNWYIYANNNPLRFVDPTGLVAVIGEHVETGEVVTELQYEAPELNAAIFRNTDSYDSKLHDTDSQGKDTMILTSKDVLGQETVLFVDGLQTVDILEEGKRDQPYSDPKYGDIQGNTIAAGAFDFKYESSKGDLLGPEILFTNTKTIDGTVIGSDGNAVGGGANRDGRWRLHNSTHPVTGAVLKNLNSDGCGITKPGTFTDIFSFFRGNVPEGSSFKGQLLEIPGERW